MKQRFEGLVDEHGGWLLQLARLMLKSASDAEDVVQDSLVKLWHQLGNIDRGAERAWLITCTRNACLDRIRAKQRQSGLLQQVQSVDRELGRHIDDHGPAAATEHHERAQQLHEAIRQLPEPARSLVILRDIQDVDVATVANTLALTPNQVKVYTFRARRTLRRYLEQSCHEQVA
ncbi:MAG: sigma-70 family RNA polymerase sigma factor [Pseudomonadota bacterium]